MKTLNKKSILGVFLTILAIMANFATFAQDEEEKKRDDRPVRSPFESVWLLDGQTIIVPSQGTFEFDILHRFGTLTNGVSDLFGFYASSNIRLGFTYTPIENLSIGFGNTKDDNLLDFNIKYSILKQTRSWSIPVGVTYFGNAVVDTGEGEYEKGSQKWSYFHEIMAATRFNSKLTVQVGANYTHYNAVEPYYVVEPDTLYSNDMIAATLKARYKVTSTLAAIIGYDHPFAKENMELDPSLSLGLEIATSSHAFQIFIGNRRGIVPQVNNLRNENSAFGGSFKDNYLIGFNITRLWNF